ncbi:LTA synthase family protein [Selenomonas sp. F0473]|uniref:LTA synthase family protein n=1 Tax=Selenomonas sp. F0473 TaxID=999423 RepID=UPI00029E1D4C|nr:sulfatase-like hydrolase/transferase [Selenomonas sp. F0473]EKU70511.1 hypothetical protein HMPREF9161_01557 [Selenomonas sp. F0473]
MFSDFFLGLQQDIKIALLPPLICAVFRLIFILTYRPKKTPFGEWRKWLSCFNYGFWWGMDFNAYVYLALLLFVSVPGAFLPAYFAVGDTVRTAFVLVYAAALYTAFIGKMIFYFHFRDTFNQTLWLGRNADKRNFADIFFNQNHGAWLLFGFLPYLALCLMAARGLLSVPSMPYPVMADGALRYAANALAFLAAILFFYWLRYGGTLRHRKKPEWDEVPTLVKNDMVLGKATIDDFIALEMVWKRPPNAALRHSDEEARHILAAVLPQGRGFAERPLEAYQRTARGHGIAPPRHIFFLLGESHMQALFDAPFARLHLMEASERFRADPHTVSINNFLSAGMISQPSLTSLLLGIYDADMELNENKDFWSGTLSTSLPLQMKTLGYHTDFWYGGGLNWGSLAHFLPALGFDESHGGPDICSADAPRTWLGVHDHIFLAEAARRIRAAGERRGFHFLYTTSNHGPYLLPFAEYGFDPERVLRDAPVSFQEENLRRRGLACAWYADQALCTFIDEMRTSFPDSLFVVTGDHMGGELPIEELLERHEISLRERLLTSFAIHHPQLTAAHFAGNTIGGHMNILPTLFELVAPKGFEYCAIERPLTEPIERVVTPYAWVTREEIGFYAERAAQPLTVSAGEIPRQNDAERYAAERDGWREMAAFYVRHPELLEA